MLPRVKIYFENGNLGLVNASADGVMGLLCTGATVGSTFLLAKPYVIYNLKGLLALGVSAANNASLYKLVSEFYAEAGDGAELWLMAFPDTVKTSDMVDPLVEDRAKALINASNGRIRGLMVSRTPASGYTPTITMGIDADVVATIGKAQQLGDAWATDIKQTPVFFLLEAYAYNGVPAELEDMTLQNSNRVSVMIGDTVVNSKKAALGLLGGRLAKIPVQQNLARVKDGPVQAVKAYVVDKVAELADLETLHNKGYITLRYFAGRAGYFFNDDSTATAATDDYSHLTARRTIDKAYRIAYNTLLDILLDQVPVNVDGTLQPTFVKAWQGIVETAIAREMTAAGELNADITDPNDKGVICYINPNQNIVGTSKLEIQVRVRPYGYARYVDVYLGFATTAF